MFNEIIMRKIIYICIDERLSIALTDLHKIYNIAEENGFSIDFDYGLCTDDLFLSNKMFVLKLEKSLLNTELVKIENGIVKSDREAVKVFIELVNKRSPKIIQEIREIFNDNIDIKILESLYQSNTLENIEFYN